MAGLVELVQTVYDTLGELHDRLTDPLAIAVDEALDKLGPVFNAVGRANLLNEELPQRRPHDPGGEA